MTSEEKFSHLENGDELGISAEAANVAEMMFYKIISELDPDILAQIADIVKSPPASDKYKTFSEEVNIRELFIGQELSD